MVQVVDGTDQAFALASPPGRVAWFPIPDVRRPGLHQLALVAVVVERVVATAQAQTFFDDFNDSSRDTRNWVAPWVEEGNGQLQEQNLRLEFSANVSAENEVFQQLGHYPSYAQPWQAQVVVAVDHRNFLAEGQTGSISLEIRNNTGDYVGIAYGAGVLTGQTERQAIVSEGTDASHPDGIARLDIRAQSSPHPLLLRSRRRSERR